MPAKIYSCAVLGLNCELIEVEVDILGALNPSLHIVGLGDTSIQESKERIRSALKNSGMEFPRKRKVVNLAPADLRKYGPLYDTAIAIGLLACSDQLFSESAQETIKNSLFIGELSLDGTLKPVHGVLPITCFAKEKNFQKLFLPSANGIEASLVSGMEILPAENLRQIINHLQGISQINPLQAFPFGDYSKKSSSEFDMKYIKGQVHAKRALEIAAGGAHNILLNGPPGSGKTLLARTMKTILPELALIESLEITKLYSISGLLSANMPLISHRPFRSVHHSASEVSIVGGGKIAKPGEISLAHKGILFLDEFAEFPSSVLESLRQPLEDRCITIGRASGTITYPAHFILVAAMNPCPCGFFTDQEKECLCSSTQIKKYQKKISGPILDRIDLYVEVPRLPFDHLVKTSLEEDSENIAKRVQRTRNIQAERFNDTNILTNSEMGPREMKKHCQLDAETLHILKEAVDKLYLSPRAFNRILKVSRTIADLNESSEIKLCHVTEALQYRKKENYG